MNLEGERLEDVVDRKLHPHPPKICSYSIPRTFGKRVFAYGIHFKYFEIRAAGLSGCTLNAITIELILAAEGEETHRRDHVGPSRWLSH